MNIILLLIYFYILFKSFILYATKKYKFKRKQNVLIFVKSHSIYYYIYVKSFIVYVDNSLKFIPM